MDVLDIYAKIRLDKSEYDKGLNDASNESKSFGSKLASGLGSAVQTVAKVGAAAVAAGATAAVALTKQAVSAYADYEQLVGGVETLFGTGGKSLEEYAASVGKSVDDARGEFEQLEEAQRFVVNRSSAAFETAGLSANQYMENVTGFSAALIASLDGDTVEAAKVADRAIIDMADNANKMGTNIDSIQTAYQGFAKQNYTMLDNLKLGYGGTKEEMARLIEDASKMTDVQERLGITVDNSSMSFDNIVNAISVMQENMGIAGATANEAATTISGSLAMMKASWQNTLAAIGEGNMEAISEEIGSLTYSATTFADNVMPVVQRALEGLSQLISELAPRIAEALPEMITNVLPALLDAGVQIIQSLGDGLLKAIPELMPAITDVILRLCEMMIEMLPQLIEVGLQVILELAMGISQALPELIPAVVDTVMAIVEYLIDNVDLLIDAAIAIIMALADGIIDALPRLIEKAPVIISKLVDALVRNFPKIVGAGTDLIVKLIEGITKSWGQVISTGAEIITQVKNGFSQKVQDALTWGKDLISNFIQGIRNKFGDVKAALSDLGNLIADLIGFSEPEIGPLSNFHTYAPDMMDLFAKGIADNENVVRDQLEKSFDFGNIGNITGDITTSTGGGGFENVLGRIEALLEQYLPNMGQDIVLDTGALVGGTVAAYDAAFNTRTNRGAIR